MAAAAGLLLGAGTAAASPAGPVLTVFKPPPKPAWISVVTKPSGLRVRIGDVEAGWSPLAPVLVAAGRVTVRAFPSDPRLFSPVEDGAVVDVAPGETLRVALDLRPYPLLLSDPTASVLLVAASRASGADSAIGETPLRVAPATLEANRVRFAAMGYADSLVSGPLLLAAAEGGAGSFHVRLRSLHLPPPPPPPAPSLFGRRWFQWALIGVGSALTGTASILRHEGDRAYDEYLASSDPREIERAYDRTIRYDRWAAGTLGGGQVLLTAGLFLLVSGVGR